jgi:hypothetical protein
MDPSENEIWTDFTAVEKQIKTSITEKKAVLCWENIKIPIRLFLLFGGRLSKENACNIKTNRKFSFGIQLVELVVL